MTRDPRPAIRVRTIAQAAAFIDRVGFCLLFPSKGLRLPSLWAAVKGRPRPGFELKARKILAVWDADAERLWRWKDELPRRRLAYSGRYFRGRKALLSLAFLPCFYRLENNYGTADEYEQLYREGRLSADAHAVAARLYKHGPQAALELRYALGWSDQRGNRRFKRALGELQQRLLIVHWGTKAETAAWESVVYELTPRAFPRAARASLKLAPEEARRRIAVQYRRLNPAATPADFRRLFGWSSGSA